MFPTLARVRFLDSYIRWGVAARIVAQARCLRYFGLTMYTLLLLPIEREPTAWAEVLLNLFVGAASSATARLHNRNLDFALIRFATVSDFRVLRQRKFNSSCSSKACIKSYYGSDLWPRGALRTSSLNRRP
jgi:hypothetical protein